MPWDHFPVIDPRPLWNFDDPEASAEKFIDAADGSPEPDRTQWLTQYARALGLLGRYDVALRLLDTLTADDLATTTYLALERGRVLRSSGEPDKARAFFDSAAGTAQAADLEALRIDALHMIALVAEPEERDRMHAEALALARSATDPNARNWDASLLNNIGMAHADAGDFAAALGPFEEALVACRRIGDDGRTRVARWMVAWALRNLGRRDEALGMQRELKAELDALGETDPYVEEELALLTS